jgi:protein MpaA
VVLLASLTAALALTDCHVSRRGKIARGVNRADGREVFGFSVESRPIRGLVLGSGPRTYLLFGVIHGNEPLGEPLLESFITHVRGRPNMLSGRRLVILPVVNPDGLARRTRVNANGVDLNRNFPARNWKPGPRYGSEPASEPETRTLIKIIRQFQPRRILAIHSPLRVVNYDGPAEALALKMADACDYPVSDSIGYATPGSLGSYAGVDWETAVITLELGKEVTRENVWPLFMRALEVFVEI